MAEGFRQLLWENGWNWKGRAWRNAAKGALLVTIPGFYIGKILPWASTHKAWFWIATVLIWVGFFYLLKKVSGVATLAPPPSASPGLGSWGFSLFYALFFFVGGYVFTGQIWWTLGSIALDSARSQILEAGLQLGIPEKGPDLPHEQNAAYYLEQASSAPSMASLTWQGEASKRPFGGYKSEYDFLLVFNNQTQAQNLRKPQLDLAKVFLTKHEDVFRWVDKAFETKRVDWNAVEDTYPHGSNTLLLARIVRCRAFFQFAKGDVEGAVRSIQTGLFLGEAAQKTNNLIGVMIEAAILKEMSETVCSNILPLRKHGEVGKRILPYLRAERLQDDLNNALEYELLGRLDLWTSNYGWLQYANTLKNGDSPFASKDFKFWNFLVGIVYGPFLPFDAATRIQFNIQVLKSHAKDQEMAWEKYTRKGWMLGLTAPPRFAQMEEKARESATYGELTRIRLQTAIYQYRKKHWPTTVQELEKACWDDWDPYSEPYSPIPSVRVTGAFVANVKSPEGNQITLAKKGEVPKTNGVGWLYDSNLGAIYVNSTVKDSKAIPYSFYGFE